MRRANQGKNAGGRPSLGLCRRCQNLRNYHNLELAELVALWEVQNRQCYYPGCSKVLTDPRIPDQRPVQGDGGTWNLRIDHDHAICPQRNHSCKECRRGLACHICNTRALAQRLWNLPEQPRELARWLEFLGPEGRDRLRAGLIQFPEQPVRRVARRSRGEDASREGAALFDLDAFRAPA
jgi:hypothetical protein